MQDPPRPLAGLLITETSDDIAVRYCGKLFAAHGATVRRLAAPAEADIAARAHAVWLDDGKQIVPSLGPAIADADLVIAGQTPAAIAATVGMLGSSKALLLAISWFGETGPYANWRGSDALIQAMNGIAYAFGPVAGPPTIPQGHSPQIIAGATAVIAAIAALRGRANGHPTARVDLSILEAALCFGEYAGPSTFLGGPASTRLGVNRFMPTYPQTIYRAADGWIGVTALTPPQWQALCDMTGVPELARDPAYASSDQRLAAADAVDARLAPAFLKRPAGEWLVEGQARRVPLGPVPTLEELLQTPHWRERGSFAKFAAAPSFEGPAMPFRLNPRAPSKVAAPATPPAKGTGPLAGLRVLDLSMGWSGPLAGRHFADLGAEVIKVEGTSHVDWWRGWDGPTEADPPAYEVRANFVAMNRNKRGITLDLNSKAGLDLARRLAARADLLLENYAPGVLDRLGLSAAVLGEANPNLVYISMGAFGSVGPWSGFRAYGSTTEQASGLPFVNGEADWPPCLQHIACGDPIAGIYAAVAAAIALYGRAKTGGLTVDLSQVECLFQLNAAAITAQSVTGRAPARTGTARAASWLASVVACAGEDQWLAVDVLAADADAFRAAVAAHADASPDAARDALAGWAATRTPAAAAAALQQAGLQAAPVIPASALVDDPHLNAVGFWHRARRRYVGEHLLPAASYHLDGARPEIRSVAPTLGEHGPEVLAAELGLAPSEIAALEHDGVIGTRSTATA
jgi:crotonobetainyl-CoA:carnitine CoA-transferase CaiB-like acyl-CoA transferase